MVGSVSDEDERHYYGPYKMTLFDPWDNFGTEAVTDLDALYEDLERWQSLIKQGRGGDAVAEIEDVLIAFRNAKSPFERMCEANARFATQKA